MSHSFYSADRSTYKKTMLVGLLCCGVFIAISYFARQQVADGRALVKADKLVRTANGPAPRP
jgi:hypothetical protein